MSGASTDVELADHALIGVVAAPEGFLLMLRRGEQRTDPQPTWQDRQPWLATLTRSGALREGPQLAIRTRIYSPLIATNPPVVHDDDTSSQGRLRRVRDDLTLDEGLGMSRVFLNAWAVFRRLWIATHPPHPTEIERLRAEGYWPLPGPPHYPEDRQYWLLTELDPDSLAPLLSTLVQWIPDQLAVDDTGTVWVQADGVRHLPPDDGAAAELLDVARLLEQDDKDTKSAADADQADQERET